MKNFTLSAIILLLTLPGFSQWEPLYLMEHNQVNQGSPVFSACVHNNALYAATKIPDQSEIVKSADGGETWTDLNFPQHIGHFSDLLSVGGRLYAANYNNWYAKSTIWYTEDDGATWHLDTTGMPGGGGPNGGAYVISMHGWNDHLIGTFGGADLFYMKAFDEPWNLVEELVPTDPNVYASRGDTIFAVKKYSPDFGETWITPANNGMPSNPAPYDLFVTNNRIYMSGDNLGSHFFVYSDDNGENWQDIDLGEFAGRPVWSIYALGDQLWLGIDSDETTKVIYSSDGGQTFTDLSAGLPEDPFGTYSITSFMHIGSSLYAVNNFQDIYKMEIEGSSSIAEQQMMKPLEVFPVPAVDRINFNQPENVEFVQFRITDVNGSELFLNTSTENNSIDISTLKPGLYFLNAYTESGKLYFAKFMKL